MQWEWPVFRLWMKDVVFDTDYVVIAKIRRYENGKEPGKSNGILKESRGLLACNGGWGSAQRASFWHSAYIALNYDTDKGVEATVTENVYIYIPEKDLLEFLPPKAYNMVS